MSTPGSFSGVMAVREQSKPRNEQVCSFSGLVAARERSKPPKTSSCAPFQEWWMPEKGPNPEDEQSCSFSGLVVARERLKPRKQTRPFVFGAGGCQRTFKTPKTSMTACFLVVVSSSSIENKFGRTLPSLIPGYPGDV
jgi:hypothetical protein